MKKFTYLVPKTLDEAVSLHQSHGDGAMYVAGATDVMVKIKSGKIVPDCLISLRHVAEHDQLRVNPDTGELHIGAFVTHRALETSSLIRLQYPIIHDAVQHIGSVQIRNVATIGGNLVNAVPSADGAIPLIALDARVKIYGAAGEREVDLIRFLRRSRTNRIGARRNPHRNCCPQAAGSYWQRLPEIRPACSHGASPHWGGRPAQC